MPRTGAIGVFPGRCAGSGMNKENTTMRYILGFCVVLAVADLTRTVEVANAFQGAGQAARPQHGDDR